MTTLWKTTLIVTGLAIGAVAGSGSALADNDHGRHSSQTTKNQGLRPAPAPGFRMVNPQYKDPAPHRADRRQDRHDRHDRDARNDRYRDHERARVHERLEQERRERDRYVRRERERHEDWRRYSRGDYGFVSPRRHAYDGYGAQWMWWGGHYSPYNPPAAFRNCYPVVRYGWYHGRHARYGGTMCYNARGTYLLPNSTFIINIY